jgi:hypothetical protein
MNPWLTRSGSASTNPSSTRSRSASTNPSSTRSRSASTNPSSMRSRSTSTNPSSTRIGFYGIKLGLNRIVYPSSTGSRLSSTMLLILSCR